MNSMTLSPLEVLETIAAAGVTVSVTGDRLNLKGPEQALTDDLIAHVRILKPALLELLSGSENSKAPQAGQWATATLSGREYRYARRWSGAPLAPPDGKQYLAFD